MVKKINVHDEGLEQKLLKHEGVSSQVTYCYMLKNKQTFYYSKDILQLFEINNITNELEIDLKYISFLLEDGVVPLPFSIYKNLYIIGIGHSIEVVNKKNYLELNFQYKFELANTRRPTLLKQSLSEVKVNLIDSMVNSLDKALKDKSEICLFHSAGKDSNFIALALSRMGISNKVTSLSHMHKNTPDDESYVAQHIAQKLGFNHILLSEEEKYNKSHISELKKYFSNIPLPSMDNVTLAYPMYSLKFDFKNKVILDGSGNDIYLGHIPTRMEFKEQNKYSKFHFLRKYMHLSSTSKINLRTRTRQKYCGLNGLTFDDCKSFYSEAIDTDLFWIKNYSFKDYNNYFDLRASIWGTSVELERVMRKVKNFSNVYNSELIFPWTSQQVFNAFEELPVEYLFDETKLKNKLIVREILKEELFLDSDSMGKKVYGFDFWNLLDSNLSDVKSEIFQCNLWKKTEVEKIFSKFYDIIINNKKYSDKAKAYILRLYLISAWYNHNRYITNR